MGFASDPEREITIIPREDERPLIGPDPIHEPAEMPERAPQREREPIPA